MNHLNDLQAVVAGTSKRSKQQIATYRKDRLKKHRLNETERPEDQRLLTRVDFDKHAYKVLARGTLLAYARIIRSFSEFCDEVLELPENSADQYFKLDGLVPSTKMIRQFIFYMADGGSGRASDRRITRLTAVNLATTFFGAFQYCNCKLEADVREQVLIWVWYDLTEELGLHKKTIISKPIAHRSDVSLILREMFSPLGLRQIRSMRLLLNIAIFINLMVDGCARIHELVSTHKYPDQFLRWRDVRFYAFRDGSSGELTIAGRVKIGNLKGQKDRPDIYKEIPLMLMAPSLWFEDSLRLLLYAALIDGHIPGASSWTDFERLVCQCDTDTGIQIPFKESSQDLPLIPLLSHTSGTVMIDKPMSPYTIPPHLKRIGKLCGFEDVLKSNALIIKVLVQPSLRSWSALTCWDRFSHAFRRGAAYNLENACNEETRTWAIGHAPGSETYMKSYKSRISTTDLQGIMHNVQQRDVLPLSSMSLARTRGAPTSLSAEGEDKVLMRPDVREASNRCKDALDALTEKYKSVTAASRDNSPEHEAWLGARNALRVLLRKERKEEMNREYLTFRQSESVLSMPTESDTSFRDPITHSSHDQGSLTSTEADGSSSLPSSSIMRSPDRTWSRDSEMDMIPIDPQLLSHDEFTNVASGKFDGKLAEELSTLVVQERPEGSVGDLDDLDAEEMKDAELDQDRNKDLGDGLTDTRLHGTYRHHLNQRLPEGYIRETQVCRSHRFDHIMDDAGSLSELELANLLIPFFKTMHALERYGKLEPQPSTFVCPCCSTDQNTRQAFDDHVAPCRQQRALSRMKQEWLDKLVPKMAVPCDWLLKTKARCNKTFSNMDKFTRHILQHSWSKAKPVCKFGECANTTNPAELHTRNQWLDHLFDTHDLTYVQASSLMYWCSFCDDFVSHGISGPSARIKHYEGHLQQALEAIEVRGYNHVHSTSGGIVTLSARHPWFCIFCVHNCKLQAPERIATLNERPGKAPLIKEATEHMRDHFMTNKDLGERVPCPASSIAGAQHPLCSSEALYDGEALEEHLDKVHRILGAAGVRGSNAKPKRVRVRGKAAIAAKAEAMRHQENAIKTGGSVVEGSLKGGSSEEESPAEAIQPPRRRRRAIVLADTSGNSQ